MRIWQYYRHKLARALVAWPDVHDPSQVSGRKSADSIGRIVSRLEGLVGKLDQEMAALAGAADAFATDSWGPGRLGGDASVRLAIVSER